MTGVAPETLGVLFAQIAAPPMNPPGPELVRDLATSTCTAERRPSSPQRRQSRCPSTI
jgi:hypothetical protein